jgi:four helix bundle protein
MPGVTSYRELIVWQKAMDLAVAVYKITEVLPSRERYGLTDQVRRAAVSVPSNIAEGQGRSTVNDFLRFLSIARGSLNEMETQILIAQRIGYLPESDRDVILRQSDEVGRLLRALGRSLTSRGSV